MSDTEGKSLAELEAKLAEAEDRLLEISTNLLRSEAEKDELVASLRRLEKEKDETEGGLTQMGRKINHLKGLEAKLKNDISNTNELYQAREKELEAEPAEEVELEKQETPPTKPEVKPEVKASKPARSMEGWMSGLKRS